MCLSMFVMLLLRSFCIEFHDLPVYLWFLSDYDSKWFFKIKVSYCRVFIWGMGTFPSILPENYAYAYKASSSAVTFDQQGHKFQFE